MKTVIILNFSFFSGRKDPSKTYYGFDMFEPEEKRVYHLIQESAYMAIPNGEIPSREDCEKTFLEKLLLSFPLTSIGTRKAISFINLR